MLKRFSMMTMMAVATLLFLANTVGAECHCECDTDPLQCKSQISKRVQAGKMKMNQKWLRIFLYEKDSATWDTLGKEGAWGFLDYRPQGTVFKFLFVGKKLEPGVDYTLIYYPDPWPGNGLICLGSGIADVDGKLKIVGKGDPTSPFYAEPQSTGNLPADYDDNAAYGAKIWLVLSSDVDCMTEQMIGWNPTEYLFENTLINFIDTDGE
jgi:hypothetical protein